MENQIQNNSNQIQLFENCDFGKIRIISENNTFWVVGKDVLRALEYSPGSIRNSSDVFASIPEEWRVTKPICTPGGTQRMLCLSEQGLYFFLGRSDKPKALPYQRWIAGEVVPSIRKTGSYSVNNNSQFNELTCLIKNVLEQNTQLSSQISQLAIENKEIKQELQVMKPKVQFYNLYVENDSTGVDCKTAAKIIGKMGRNKLFAFLRRKNLIMSDNMPYQKYVDLGLFSTKYSKTGFPVLMITKKGVEKIGQLLDNNSSQ